MIILCVAERVTSSTARGNISDFGSIQRFPEYKKISGKHSTQFPFMESANSRYDRMSPLYNPL
jgi:hypothetical protein